MSIPAFGWALEQGVRLKLLASDRLVLIYLADLANGALVCWPGQPLIERFTGLAPNTVMVSLKRLERAQLIRAETSPGRATRYHILRNVAPANGAGVAADYPPKSNRGAPANGAGVPPQNVGDHPRNRQAEPPHNLRPTPANGAPDPSSTQERDPKSRASAREASKILRFGKKQEDAAPQPQAIATPGSDDFNSFLEAPTPGKALPCEIEQDVIHADVPDDPLDLPVDPEYVRAVVAELSHEYRMRAYPARAATASPDDQITTILPPSRPKPHHLTGPYLAAMRKQAGIRHAANA
jgi:Helix-turn-helix domain